MEDFDTMLRSVNQELAKLPSDFLTVVYSSGRAVKSRHNTFNLASHYKRSNGIPYEMKTAHLMLFGSSVGDSASEQAAALMTIFREDFVKNE